MRDSEQPKRYCKEQAKLQGTQFSPAKLTTELQSSGLHDAGIRTDTQSNGIR